MLDKQPILGDTLALHFLFFVYKSEEINYSNWFQTDIARLTVFSLSPNPSHIDATIFDISPNVASVFCDFIIDCVSLNMFDID